MNLFEYSTKGMFAVTLIALIVGVFNLVEINEKSTKYYQYENGKINTFQVKTIRPRVEYFATLSQDEEIKVNKKYSTSLNEGELENLRAILSAVKDSDYYRVEIVSFLAFDEEKANVYKSQRYLKNPSLYSVTKRMLDTLRTHGIDDYQYEKLSKMQGESFSDKKEFVDKVIAVGKLKRNDWVERNVPTLGLSAKAARFVNSLDIERRDNLLEDDDVEKIMDELNGVYDAYLGIK